jgi:hypothetical protein
MTFGLWKVKIKSGLADNRELQFTIPQISVDKMFPRLIISSDTQQCWEADLSTMASIDSAMSKYISLFECRIPCLRHGIGAASGAVVGAWILPDQLDGSSIRQLDIPRNTSYIQQFPHKSRREDNFLEHG